MNKEAKAHSGFCFLNRLFGEKIMSVTIGRRSLFMGTIAATSAAMVPMNKERRPMVTDMIFSPNKRFKKQKPE